MRVPARPASHVHRRVPDVRRRTRRSSSTVGGTTPDITSARPAADRAGARPYLHAREHVPDMRRMCRAGRAGAPPHLRRPSSGSVLLFLGRCLGFSRVSAAGLARCVLHLQALSNPSRDAVGTRLFTERHLLKRIVPSGTFLVVRRESQ